MEYGFILQDVVRTKNPDPMNALSTIADLRARNSLLQKELNHRTQELNRMKAELADMSMSCFSISEMEKQTIAREIHDDLGQYLTALKMAFSWVRKQNGKNPDQADQQFTKVDNLLDETILSFKNIQSALQPDMLKNTGLIHTLKWYVDNFRRFSETKVKLYLPGTIQLAEEYALALYRIIQESLSNANRYSGASQISLHLFVRKGWVYLRINDNGKGFDTDTVDTGMHHGLLGMKERAYSCNGNISIVSRKDMGTSVNVRVPHI